MSIQPERLADADHAGPVAGLRHVAIIMDGNGRWAAQRGLPRSEGHRRGVEAVRETVRVAPEFGIKYLTLFSFSSENWSRPPDEVNFLFSLIKRFVHRDLAELHGHGVRITVIGDRDGIPREIRELLEEAESRTRDNVNLNLLVAFNYGGRGEMARAAARIADKVRRGLIAPDQITERVMAQHLDAPEMPDADLLIRTGGEIRISNFILWQAAYAELFFLPCFWPDFDRAAFAAVIDEFHRRERRFGGVVAGAGA